MAGLSSSVVVEVTCDPPRPPRCVPVDAYINVGPNCRIAPKDDIYDLILNKTGSAGLELVFVNLMYSAGGRASLRPRATYVIAIQVYANPAQQEV